MLQEITTPMPPAEVLAAAKRFFARRSPIYAAFLEKEGPTYLTFRGQGGEELVIAVSAIGRWNARARVDVPVRSADRALLLDARSDSRYRDRYRNDEA